MERQSSGDFNATVVNCHQSSEAVPGDYDGSVLPEKPSPSTLVPNTPEHNKVGVICRKGYIFISSLWIVVVLLVLDHDLKESGVVLSKHLIFIRFVERLFEV